MSFQDVAKYQETQDKTDEKEIVLKEIYVEVQRVQKLKKGLFKKRDSPPEKT